MKLRKPALFRSTSSLSAAIALGCLAMLIPATLSAATTFTFGFDTNGDTEGFTGTSVTSLAASGGFLTGTAVGGDPRLEIVTAAADSTPIFSKSPGETWGTISFRVRETDETPAVVTPFDPTGIVIVLNNTNSGLNTPGRLIIGSGGLSNVDSGDGFFTVTADFSSYAQDEIRYFRFDPIGGADAGGNLFEVDFVEITAIPEPTAMLLGSFGLLGLLRRRR